MEELTKLRAAANAACSAAFEIRANFIQAAVNWADFACTRAQRWEDDQGDAGYRVDIEEADPNNREVFYFIRNELMKAGFPDVEVCFEW